MFEFLRQLITGIQEAWQRLSVNARVQIGLSALLTILLLGGAIYMGAQPQYTQAYSNLDPSETNTMASWLADNSIGYKVTGNGTGIMVPDDQVSSLRMAMSEQNIPKSQGSIPGFEIFNQRDMRTNKFLQDVDLARAYNGELQRQLNRFDFVRNSTVFIQKAERSFFRNEQEPAEAAVTLEVLGGSLTPGQIKAVVHLVSTYGGANLTRNGITITNTQGEVLHSPITDKFTAIATDRLGNKVELETQLEQKIEAMFNDIGRRAKITVSAHLDWSTEDTTSSTLGEPKEVASLTKETTSTTSESSASLAPGVTANIADGSSENTGVISETLDSETVVNNEFDETKKVKSLAPGRTQKYSVTAMIEGDYDETGEGENIERAYIGLSDELLEKFTKSIAGAVGEGIEPTDVFVMDLPFKVSSTPMVAAAVSSSFLSNPYLRQGVQGLLILLSFILLRVMIRRAMVLPTVEEEEVIEMPTMTPEEQHAQNVADEVARLSREEPETVAALLRNWMSEDQ